MGESAKTSPSSSSPPPPSRSGDPPLYHSNGRSNPKNSKNEVHLFSNFGSGRILPTQSTGPQPIQLVPKHRFLQTSQQRPLKSKKFKKRGAFIFEFWFWKNPPHPDN